MDPRRVLTFRAVAQRGSFSHAARDLALSQPAVSNQVAQLERELGAPLLERRPGGLELTTAGKIVLEHADVIAARLELARTQVAAVAADRHARLRMGAFPTALASLVPAVVERLRGGRPDLRVSFDEGTASELSAKVDAGELDIAIVFEEAGAVPAAPRSRLVMREHLMAALAPDHRLAAKRSVRLAELADEDWSVGLPDGLIVRACRAAGYEPHVVSIASDPVAIRALVMRGLAVTLVPGLLAEAFADLALRPIAGTDVARDVHALLPPGALHPLMPAVLETLAAIASELTQAPPKPGRQSSR